MASTASTLGLLRAARPNQWVKNLLVFAAPAAAGVLTASATLTAACGAFLAFTAVSAATYLVNDVLDLESDRAHPTKRHRPIAAGVVTPATAIVAATVLAAIGLGGPLLAGQVDVALLLAGYVVMTTAYSLGAKRVPIFEMAVVAAGFVLRTLAGALATDVVASQWFLIVVSAGAFHLAATKRFAELRRHGSEKRPVLARYSPDILAEMRFSTAAVALTAYLLWAFSEGPARGASPWFELSAVPFTLALFRYGAAVHEGHGEAPEEVLMRDRHVQAYGAVWVVLFALGTYGP